MKYIGNGGMEYVPQVPMRDLSPAEVDAYGEHIAQWQKENGVTYFETKKPSPKPKSRSRAKPKATSVTGADETAGEE